MSGVPARKPVSPAGSEVERHWVRSAVQRMTLDGLPAGCNEYDFAQRRLLALCRELQQMNEAAGRDDFILGTRQAARAIGLDPNRDRMRVHRLLTSSFVAEGWIEVVSRGAGRPGSPANVYRFIGRDHRPRGSPDETAAGAPHAGRRTDRNFDHDDLQRF